MKPRISVLRRMTTSVAVLVLVSALVGFGSPVANAAETSTPGVAGGHRSASRPGPRLFHGVVSRRQVAVNCVLERAPESSPAVRRPRVQRRGSGRGPTASRGVRW